MDKRLVIHDAGPDQDLIVPELGRWWSIYEWPNDDRARLAWEAVREQVSMISCWRTRHPAEPPHTRFMVWNMGEAKEHIEMASLICAASEGTAVKDPDVVTVAALRLRRQDQAIEALAAGRGQTQFVNRTPEGWRIDRHGKRRPR